MADFSALIASIEAYVKQNGNNDITGNGLQTILDAIVNVIGGVLNDTISDLSAEVTARQNGDGTLQDNIDEEALARAAADTVLDGRIATIEGKIPTEATAENQLADKAFVNALVEAIITPITELIPSAASETNKLADKEWVANITDALSTVINAVKDDVKNGYVYAGIAKPWSAPVTGKVFYFATTSGRYTNFGNIEVPEGINIIRKSGGSWVSEFVFSNEDLRNEIAGFEEQVRNWMCDYKPIVVNGDVTNAPDEVDLTAAPDNLLKFKNKAYNPVVWSGLGKKYLRKNIIPEVDSASFDGFVEDVPTQETLSGTPDGIFWDRINEIFVGKKDDVYYIAWTDDDNFVPVSTELVYMYDGTPYRWNGADMEVDESVVPTLNNILTQAMISDENTIYVIRYDFDLKGETVTIPENCVLEFEGGSLSNGSVDFNHCAVCGLKKSIFKNIISTGIISNNYYIEWFDGDVSDTLESLSTLFETKKEKKLITTELQQIVMSKGCHLYANYTNIDFNGAQIIVNTVSDYAFWIYSLDTSSITNETPRFFRNARLVDTSRSLSKKGIVLGGGNDDGTDFKICAHYNIENCFFKYLDKGAVFLYNSYIITFYNCQFKWNNIGLYQIAGHRNYGERYNLIASVVSDSYFCGIILQGDIYTGLFVDNCSLDCNRQEVIVKNGSRIYIDNTWIESRYIGELKFLCYGQSSVIDIHNCVINNWRGDLYDVDGNVITTLNEDYIGPQIYCDADSLEPCHGGVYIRDNQLMFFDSDTGDSYIDGTSNGSAAVVFDNNCNHLTNLCLNKSIVSNAAQFNKLLGLDSATAYSFVDGDDVVVKFSDVQPNRVVLSFKTTGFYFKPDLKLNLEFEGTIDNSNAATAEFYARTTGAFDEHKRLMFTRIKESTYLLNYQYEWTSRINSRYEAVELVLTTPSTVTGIRFSSENWEKSIPIDSTLSVYRNNRLREVFVSATRLIELLYDTEYHQWDIINTANTTVSISDCKGLIPNYSSIQDLYEDLCYQYPQRIELKLLYKDLLVYNAVGSQIRRNGNIYIIDFTITPFFIVDKNGYRCHITLTENRDNNTITISNVVTETMYVQKFAGEFIDIPSAELSVTGQAYFDRTNEEQVICDGTNWLRYDKSKAGTRTFGTFAQKPTVNSNRIKVGFRYFCTDKQTPEQAAISEDLKGIEIIHKGNDVWVDALGRVVEETENVEI